MPALPKTPNHKTITTILLALLLHIVIALVLYVSLYKRPETNPPQPTTVTAQPHDKSVATTTERHDNKKKASIAQKTHVKNTSLSTTPTQNVSQEPKNKTPKKPANTSATTANKSSSQPSTNTPALNTPDFDSAIDKTNDIKAVNTKADKIESKKAANSDEPNNQSAEQNPRHQLQTTKEYERLDNELDKDAERLSVLINQIKERNQQQIDKQQANKPIEPLKPANPNDEMMTPDYPITPITPADDPKAD